MYGGHRPRTHTVCRGVTGPGHTECERGLTQDTQSVQRGHAGREGSRGEGAVVKKVTGGGSHQKIN